MNQLPQIVYLARHGETAWTLSGQYMGLIDLPLTERGERHAQRLAEPISRHNGDENARPFLTNAHPNKTDENK
jgi:broad specificity phosphatase PhoE